VDILSKENKYRLFSEKELARKLDVLRYEIENKAVNWKKGQSKKEKGERDS
jgi:hypothetical protein